MPQFESSTLAGETYWARQPVDSHYDIIVVRDRVMRSMINFTIEIEREEDGRQLAEVMELAGVLAYGQTQSEAIAIVQALAFRVLADRLKHGEATPELMSVSFVAA